MKQYKVWKGGKVVETPYPGLYAGITTMKIFGRLDCKSGMRAKKENRIFFRFWEDAVEAGFRPCKLCKPAKHTRENCDHVPFGLTGGYALKLEPRRVRVRISCTLCEKLLGWGKITKQGIKWRDGMIVWHRTLLAKNQ